MVLWRGPGLRQLEPELERMNVDLNVNSRAAVPQ
jgi:hypothetical protein